MRKQLISTAALNLVLIAPAALFMGALLARNLPLHGVAAGAQQIVMWYAGRVWTLWVLLLLLPFSVLITGCAALFHGRIANTNAAPQLLPMINPEPATIFVAALTISAAGILAIVVLHMLAN